jgi:hypothetical protein
MSEIREIADVLQKIARTATSDYIKFFYATVESVDESERTCTAKALDDDSDEPLLDIQLMAEPNDGMLKIPTVGSEVIVGYNRDDNPFVICFGQLDKVICHTEVVFQFNKGELGGLTKTKVLQDELGKLNAQLQAVISSLSNWTTVPNDGGAALKAYFASQIAGKTAGDFSAIENTKVTH